jgi:hypothetical protein
VKNWFDQSIAILWHNFMTKPFQLRVNWTIVSLMVMALSNLVASPTKADDALPWEDSPGTPMATNSIRKVTMSQSQTVLHQRLDRMQVIRQIQGSNQIWRMGAGQRPDAYQEALALTWQDFWQQQNRSIDTFNQHLQSNYIRLITQGDFLA